MQLYTSNPHRRDIEDLSIMLTHMWEPKVEKPDKSKENEGKDKKRVTTKRALKFSEIVYNGHIK